MSTVNSQEMHRLVSAAVEAVERDVILGQAVGEPWEIADDDAWDAVAIMGCAEAPEMTAALATTAGVLKYAADVLWVHWLVEWMDHHVRPMLDEETAAAYMTATRKLIDEAFEIGTAFTDDVLRPFAQAAWVNLPKRR